MKKIKDPLFGGGGGTNQLKTTTFPGVFLPRPFYLIFHLFELRKAPLGA